MKTKKCTTITCTGNTEIARDVHELHFCKPEGFVFKPGQFVLFDIPLKDDPENIETRALSIASTPDKDELLFIMKLKSGGRISEWIRDVLRKGSTVAMQGPFGFFILDTQTTKEYLFVATSTGVGPFRSQIISALSSGETRRMDLVFGLREEKDLFWKHEFEDLAKRFENFFLHIALSQPTKEWKGHRGRVQTLVPLIVRDFLHKNIYVCGSPDMTKDMKELCLNTWGVKKEDMHVEGYI